MIGVTKNKDVKPDIRYADPSHGSYNAKKSIGDDQPRTHISKPDRAPSNNNSSGSYPRKKAYSKKSSPGSSALSKNLLQLFTDQDALEGETLSYLRDIGRDGAPIIDINHHVAGKLVRDTSKLEAILDIKKIRDALSQARRNLGKKKLVGYNRTEAVWYPVPNAQKETSDKEKRYLAAKGVKGDWVRIPDKIEAIKSLHKNFTPDQFENFCCRILEHSKCKNLSVTEKRAFSGADGGIDGLGEYTLEDGQTVKVAFEAKCHKPDNQVGSDIAQKLTGAMMEHNIRHGFIITTALFSERAKQSVQKTMKNSGNSIMIELIDQNRLADIMLYRGDAPHGFGLHRTDEYGLLYMNEQILIDSAK